MPLKTVFVGPFIDSTVEDYSSLNSLTKYAIDLAGSQSAHLSVGIGLLKYSVPSVIIKEGRSIISAANEERRQQTDRFAAELAKRIQSSGLASDLGIIHDSYKAITHQLARMARLADVAVLQPSNELLSLQQGLVEDTLFDSGRPVIIVPRKWNVTAAPERIAVSWDGSAKAARAIGDALPLLQSAKEVEILCVSGDSNKAKKFDGADIAPHLARYCRSVNIVQLTSSNGDVAAALRDHAALSNPNLLVMGAYAHARLTQMILGGVTSSMIVEPPVPVFMSY
ncbi:universal stress protein [Roseiarcaceae bacterium H3SJ34-1]|uniref:universal stress protein n=1 Tax=Terripilifer ovatus TaxID=3032367 RepID=UPI003AB96DA0|nr:universal stress protein [Roseiarcaceae bacterium H3SJ34-1]